MQNVDFITFMFLTDLVRTNCPDCYIDSQILRTSADMYTDNSSHEGGADVAAEADLDDSFTVSTSSQSQSASRGGIAATSQADCLMSGIVESRGLLAVFPS